MSRTKKDLSWSVLAHKDGVVSHDHRKGVCITGTWEDVKKQRKERNAHLKVCTRYTYIVDCVHNAERESLQHKVWLTRKNNPAMIGDDGEPYRLPSGEAMSDMISTGYFPNCDEVKTHKIDLRTVDVKFLPGERYLRYNVWTLPGNRQYTRRLSERQVFGARFDPNATCKVCDNFQEITCHLNPKHPPREYAGCSCCTYPRQEPLTKTRLRGSLKNMAKKYNTQGDVDG